MEYSRPVLVQDTIKLSECLPIVETPMECLCDENEVCQSIFHASVIKCPVDNSTSSILDTLRPKIKHAVAWFDSS